MTGPPKPRLPLQKGFLLLLILLPLSFCVYLVHTTPPCAHILLFCQPRHGSTWLLDSVERCRFSQAEQVQPGMYGKRTYLDTELWHIHDSSLRNITPADVVRYLHTNCSLKIFATTLDNYTGRVQELVRLLPRSVPVVVLQRDPMDAWRSREEAFRTGTWAKVKGQIDAVEPEEGVETVEPVGKQKEREKWLMLTKNFFGAVGRLLSEEGVSADWLRYERVKDQRWIWLRRGGCYVRNCNFL